MNYRLAPLPEADAVRLFQERAGARAQASLDGDRAGELVGRSAAASTGFHSRSSSPRRGWSDSTCRTSRGTSTTCSTSSRRRSGADGAPRTLRATVEWSDALLTEDERLLLRRMAVFAGGFDLMAVNAICASDGDTAAKIADLTARLVEVAAPETRRHRLVPAARDHPSVRSGTARPGR